MHSEHAPLDARAQARRAPTASVVVAWEGATRDLESLLLQLSNECEATGTELILAHSTTASHQRRLRRLFPHVRLAHAPADTPLPQLRQLGAKTATGDILILVDSLTGADKLVLSDFADTTARFADRQRHDGQAPSRTETRDTALG